MNLRISLGKGLKNYQDVIVLKDKGEKSCEQICKENNIDLSINDLDGAIKRNKKARWEYAIEVFNTMDNKQKITRAHCKLCIINS